MKQSEYLKGILWAEEYIQKGVLFEDDETGVDSLNWELEYSGNFKGDEAFYFGACDYLKHYKERLL